ncbi:MAG: radical SAM protein [Anaerolineae bacterium]|nr:radical SAM protein [Anaerolineae bacterium]
MFSPRSLAPTCPVCQRTSRWITAAFGWCGDCLRGLFADASARVRAIHTDSRTEFDLPIQPPRTQGGVRCTLCANECVIGEGERGFCNLRTVRQGKLVHLAGTPARGLLHWYRDPLPTNCVADWVCAGSAQRGAHNLAVFYASCTMNCLYCQNWHYREISPDRHETLSATELAAAANARTFCVCYFGGDPASQMPHALASAKLFAQRGVRVCWETNGTMHPKLLDAAVHYSLSTGGCIKFDLKAYDESLHLALTGVSNRRTLENFARAARRFGERPEPPLVVASTLLVPGYVDENQVGKLARFIASFDPRIPYALLGFAPNFYLSDLPCTSARQAHAAENAARAAGLVNVHIGNRHLLNGE